jgi:uncharacterized protein
MNHPLVYLLMTGIGVYLAKMWYDDLRRPHANALPGATAAPPSAVFIAMSGALMILLLETAGENWLGISVEQSKMTWLFALYSMIGAPVVEELVFRGYFVIEQRGKGPLWFGIVIASLLFAVLHPFLWKWDESFSLSLTRKGWFSTGVLFITSLWLYTARFGPWNRSKSLLPSVVGHAAKNVGVVIIKASAGYLGGAWT